MKKSLLWVFLALLFVGCDDGGGSKKVNDDDNNTTSNIEDADNSPDSSDSASDPFDTDPIVTPSNTPNMNSYESRFETGFDSTTSFDYWGCLAQEKDNNMQMLLVTSNEGELTGQISVNDGDFIPSTWSADASTLTVVPSDEFSDLEFSTYNFASDTEWSAKFVSGTYSDTVNCVLYDQDNQPVASNSDDVNSPQNDSTSSELATNKLINPANSEGDLNDLWSCKSDDDDPFVVAYLTTGKMLISIDGGDVLTLDWSIDVSKSTIFWEGASDTLEFNSVEFQSDNSHSGYFEGTSKYQCIRESL